MTVQEIWAEIANSTVPQPANVENDENGTNEST
jgi:hypothetical protein